MFKRSILAVGTFLSLVAFNASAGYAQDIAAAVDFADVVIGVGAVAASIAAVLVVKRGALMLLGFIGR